MGKQLTQEQERAVQRNQSRLMLLRARASSLKTELSILREARTDYGKSKLTARIETVREQALYFVRELRRLQAIQTSSNDSDNTTINEKARELRTVARSIKLRDALGKALAKGLSHREFWDLMRLGYKRASESERESENENEREPDCIFE